MIYRAPGPADAAPLAKMARAAFADTFAAHFPPEPLGRYLDAAYGPEGTMARDLSDPAVSWRLAIEDGAIVGYAKLAPVTSPAPAPRPRALELGQLYVVPAVKGQGVAAELMEWTLATARSRGADELYVAVFDWNARACAFYARYGFEQVAAFEFDLGGLIVGDTLRRRDL